MEKGDKTRLEIFEKAKEYFAIYGYKNTKMKDVTDALGLQPSWISYYFKTKSKIATEIIVEVSQKISRRMTEAVGEIDNPLLKRFIHMRLNYKIITSDPAALRFIYEVSGMADVDSSTRERLESLVTDISDYYGLRCREEDLTFFSDISLDAFNLTWKRYYEGQYKNLSEDRLSLDATKIFALLLGINSDTLNRIAKRSKAIANKIDVSDIRFFR